MRVDHVLRAAVRRLRVRVAEGSARLEVTRRPADGNPADLRINQLRARQMLRGELDGEDLNRYVEERVGLTTLEQAQNWARANAPWPLTFGLACCAIEMITVVGSPRVDASRLELIAADVRERFGDEVVVDTMYYRERATLEIRPWAVHEVLRYLKNDADETFPHLMSVHGCDYLPGEPRLGVHYELISRERVERLTVRTR